MSHSAEAWQTKRARLNHDALKNQLLLEVSFAIRVFEGRLQLDQSGDQLLLRLRDSWSKMRDEWADLLSRFECEMSPARLFAEEPLNRIDAKEREWMRDLVHRQWWTNSGMNGTIDNCRARIRKVDNIVGSMLQNTAANGSRVERRPAKGQRGPCDALSGTLTELYRQLKELSDALSALPADIRLAVIPPDG